MKYLYRAALHAVTGKSPAFLMFPAIFMKVCRHERKCWKYIEMHFRKIKGWKIKESRIKILYIIGDEVLVARVHSELTNCNQSSGKKLALSLKFVVQLLKSRISTGLVEKHKNQIEKYQLREVNPDSNIFDFLKTSLPGIRSDLTTSRKMIT